MSDQAEGDRRTKDTCTEKPSGGKTVCLWGFTAIKECVCVCV